MPTNLAIDDQLLERAFKASGLRTKRETVNQALREYLERRLQARILDDFGSFDFDPEYDYKEQRRSA